MILKKQPIIFPLRLFADDTPLTASGKDLDVLLQRINSELPAIHEWLCSNRLTLNLSKTKYLVFNHDKKLILIYILLSN